MEQIFKEASEIIPLPTEELVKPEKQKQIQMIQTQLEELRAKNPNLFSAAENVLLQIIDRLPINKINK
jgi:hypothetical protein